ncbi:MAG: DUF455 family protein [Tepidiformaceae bacterium]
MTSDSSARRVSGRRQPLRTYYTVEQNTHVLRSEFCLEFELFTTLAGAIPSLPELEAKTEMSHHVHSGMLRAQEFRTRLADFLLYEPERNRLPTWTNFVRHLMTAPSRRALLSALYHVIRPAQLRAYEFHASTTLALNDAPTVELFQRHLEALRREIAWGRRFLRRKARTSDTDSATASLFVQAIRDHLRLLGGPMGVPPHSGASATERYPAWKRPRAMQLEERFEIRSADRYATPGWPLHEAVPSAYVHFTELPVIDILGVTIYDGRAIGMPFEFYAEFARQLWDEARHTMMGFERLRAFGIDPYKVPIPVGHFTLWANLSVLDRLASLTQVGEACSFEPKRQWVSAAWKRNDPLSALEHEYDIVDERAHVRFGKRWALEIMKRTGETRTFKQVVQDADWLFRVKLNRLRKRMGENWVKDIGERFEGCGTNTSPINLAPALQGMPNIIA